jgi:iron complex transport system ATP-binding protein
VLELVDELRRQDGLTVIAAMHDLGTAARYADRLALLHRGELAALGAPADVLDEALVSRVYGHPVRVHELDGHLVVVPAPRTAPHTPAASPASLTERRRSAEEQEVS